MIDPDRSQIVDFIVERCPSGCKEHAWKSDAGNEH